MDRSDVEPRGEGLYLEACRRFGSERADLIRPALQQLAKDIELIASVSLSPDEEP
jgi:hypothetical protein